MTSLFLTLAFLGLTQSTHANVGIVASQVSCQYLQSAVQAGHTLIIGKNGTTYNLYDPCGPFQLFNAKDGLCFVRPFGGHQVDCSPSENNPNGGA